MDEIVNLLHLWAGADHLIAAAGLFQLLLDVAELPLERASFMSPLQHCLEIPYGRRLAAVAIGPQPDQFGGSCSQRVIGHHDTAKPRSDDPATGAYALLQQGVVRVQIKNRNVAAARGKHASDSVFGRFTENLELFSQRGRENLLQFSVFRIQTNPNHFDDLHQLALHTFNRARFVPTLGRKSEFVPPQLFAAGLWKSRCLWLGCSSTKKNFNCPFNFGYFRGKPRKSRFSNLI